MSALAAGIVAAAVAGCGFGANPGSKAADVRVSSDFGSDVLGTATEQHVPKGETVMSLLKRHFKVATTDGGGLVRSIAGRAGGADHLTWSYYVNGIAATKGAAVTDVYKSDHIWWDLHSSAAAGTVPAVVGSYPEPFTDGLDGQEYPTLLECAGNLQKACDAVGSSLAKAGVKAGPQVLGTGSGSDSLAVVVGTWNEIQGVIAAEMIAAGPGSSGVYAQFVGKHGQELELDNPLGDVVKTLSGTVGMIAATDQAALGAPTWFVTGTNVAAVDNAAKYFNSRTLDGRFAVVIEGSKVVPIPLTGT